MEASLSSKITISVLDVSDSLQWDEYVNQHPDASIYHLFSWKKLIERTFGHECIYLCASDLDGNICGVLPSVNLKSMLFGNYVVSMPYFNYGGVLADDESIAKALNRFLESHALAVGVSHVQYREQEERLGNKLAVSTSKVNMILQLPETSEALGKLIGSKRRSQIKRPIKEGVVHKLGGEELLGDFYSVFCQNMRDLGTPVYGRNFFEAILEQFKESCFLCVVYWEGKPVSAGFLLRYKDRLEIPWASTLGYANRISVNMYLYWQILSFAIESGCKEFDFGRSTIDEGTYRFKKQWKSEPRQCYWYHWVPKGEELPDLSPKNRKFDLAIKAWKKLPLPIANTLGPMLVKNLP